jgi:hypothetical protein
MMIASPMLSPNHNEQPHDDAVDDEETDAHRQEKEGPSPGIAASNVPLTNPGASGSHHPEQRKEDESSGRLVSDREEDDEECKRYKQRCLPPAQTDRVHSGKSFDVPLSHLPRSRASLSKAARSNQILRGGSGARVVLAAPGRSASSGGDDALRRLEPENRSGDR